MPPSRKAERGRGGQSRSPPPPRGAPPPVVPHRATPSEASTVTVSEHFLHDTLTTLHETLTLEINAALSSIMSQNGEMGIIAPASPNTREIMPFSKQGGGHDLLPGQLNSKESEPDPDDELDFELRQAATSTGGRNKRGSVNMSAPNAVFTSKLRGDDSGEDFAKALFKKIDVDNSGDVTKNELLRAFKTDDVVIGFCTDNPKLKPLLHFKSFKEAFQAIDIDNSDSVSLDEFRTAIDKLIENGVNLTDDTTALTVQNRNAFQMELKQKALDDEVYDVSKYYSEKGCFQFVARSDNFQNLTLAVIALNAVYIGVDIQYNEADHVFKADWGFMVVDFFFVVFFTFEIIVRFGAFKSKLNCLRDGWFKFDTVLVLLMLTETFVFPFLGSIDFPTSAFRLLRLLRLTRMARLMRAVPELCTIIKGIYVATRAVLSTFSMIVMLIYIFAILMYLLLSDEPELNGLPTKDGVESENYFFPSLGFTMFTLFSMGMLMDGVYDLMIALIEPVDMHPLKGFAGLTIFFLFIMITTFTVLNLMVGVLVEVVGTVKETETEEAETNLVKMKILKALKQFDDGDGLICEEELNEVMIDPQSVAVLEAIGVDLGFLQTLQVMSYEAPDATVPISDLIDQMLLCRKQQQITMKHMIAQQHLTIWMLTNKIMQHEKRMDAKLDVRFETLYIELKAFGLEHRVAPAAPPRAPPVLSHYAHQPRFENVEAVPRKYISSKAAPPLPSWAGLERKQGC